MLSSKTFYVVSNQNDRESVKNYIEKLFPERKYSERIGRGRDAHGLDNCDGPLRPSDPRLCQTYAEFPLPSFDELLDCGLKYLNEESSDDSNVGIDFVDIGSGLGKIVLYCALTRTNCLSQQFQTTGIEIAPLLHNEATQILEEAVNDGLLRTLQEKASESDETSNRLQMLLGDATDNPSQALTRANIIFAYTTAFSAKAFSPELGALVLDPEWSEALSQICAQGCIAITTDRALDPRFGWKLLDRLDVPNPEVLGTTGYIHILRSN